MKKRFLILFLLLVGCTKQPQKLTYINLETLMEKVDDEDCFYVEFVQNGCVSCSEFKTILISNLPSNAPTYVYELTKEDKLLNIYPTFKEYFCSLAFTPTIYQIQNGEIKKSFTYDEDLKEEDWLEWLEGTQ